MKTVSIMAKKIKGTSQSEVPMEKISARFYIAEYVASVSPQLWEAQFMGRIYHGKLLNQ
jgi:hypothetical protein